jgi:hypothetical protein
MTQLPLSGSSLKARIHAHGVEIARQQFESMDPAHRELLIRYFVIGEDTETILKESGLTAEAFKKLKRDLKEILRADHEQGTPENEC